MLDTILIIDDDLSHRAALAECFEAAGYDVVTAEDGVQGAQCITTLRPGIVVMEALLPRRDGFELCNWLKSDPRFKHMPVILITSIHLTAEQKRQGIAVGRKQFVFRADRL